MFSHSHPDMTPPKHGTEDGDVTRLGGAKSVSRLQVRSQNGNMCPHLEKLTSWCMNTHISEANSRKLSIR
ncbi:hypothetical protein KILIM_034_00220 [Kineosphaera limosa NBRC 100340]|uniref:Uncharacterized protein n=1 Tax=Kineosphaera limosa NBRC 100340 TaxID=1184609 RepID=K6VJ74_9MICO|nr:hypothetical protein KILIM_034_00220 [Kineosphaera limosa NBRC 100340]